MELTLRKAANLITNSKEALIISILFILNLIIFFINTK